ncbi:MAG TPA: hypothetical protein VHR41_01250 [Gemmatimonadales bacterium]|jgi:hypothetical protein|nr:hypothetical protein [Gemmatimonadales bacterium]
MTMPDVPSGRAPIDADFGPEPTTTFPAATGAEERDVFPEVGEGGSGKARAQMRQVKNQVVDQAKSSIRQARDRATSSLTESRFQAAEQIGGIATAFRRTGEHLRDENQARVADLAESLAEQAERASSYLRDRDFAAVRQDLEGLARRQPAVVLGVGFALGLLGARFFKSSERRQSAGGHDAGA